MPGFWLSAQLLFVLPNGVLSLCDAMVEGPLLVVFCQSRRTEIDPKRPPPEPFKIIY